MVEVALVEDVVEDEMWWRVRWWLWWREGRGERRGGGGEEELQVEVRISNLEDRCSEASRPSGGLLVATAGRSSKNRCVWTPGRGPGTRFERISEEEEEFCITFAG